MTTGDPKPLDLDGVRRRFADVPSVLHWSVSCADVPALVAEVERMRTAYAELGRVFDETVEVAHSNRRKNETLAAVVEAAYGFADEMAGYCSPHGVSSTYAQRLRERLDRAASIESEATS